MDILNCISQAIFDKKGVNILALDVRNCPTTADYVIIAEGLADKHVTALAEGVLHSLAQEFSRGSVECSFEQGMKTGDWVVLDFSWLVVHLFMPGIRDHYDLESLWREADIVDVVIKVPKMQLAL